MLDSLPCDESVPFYESYPLEYTVLTPSETDIVVPTGTTLYFDVETSNRCNNDWYHNGVRKYTMNGVYCTSFGRNFGIELGTHIIKIDSYNNVSSLSHTWTVTVVEPVDDGTNTDNTDQTQENSNSSALTTVVACGALALMYLKNRKK